MHEDFTDKLIITEQRCEVCWYGGAVLFHRSGLNQFSFVKSGLQFFGVCVTWYCECYWGSGNNNNVLWLAKLSVSASRTGFIQLWLPGISSRCQVWRQPAMCNAVGCYRNFRLLLHVYQTQSDTRVFYCADASLQFGHFLTEQWHNYYSHAND